MRIIAHPVKEGDMPCFRVVQVILIASAVGLTSIPANAQGIPVTTLSKPDAEFPEGYANLRAMVELPNDRLMVLEFCERVVKLLDFGTGEETQVSRTGSGPGEYRSPVSLFMVAGDSAILYDAGNSRYLVIGPDAKPVRSFPRLPTQTETRGNAVIMTGAFNVAGSDRNGWLYAREGGIRPGANGMERMDSVAVERWHFSSGRRDTVAFFRLLGKPGPMEMRPTPPTPFETGTQWAVAPDGRVALVHPQDYRVDFVSPAGVRTNGRPIGFTPIRVTDGHKADWLESRQPPCGTGPMTFTGADGKTISARAMAPTPPTEWPEVLPPFLSGEVAFGPDGMLWIKRTMAAGEPPTFDVIDPAGRVVQRVVLAPRSKLLGFGKSSLYVLRIDEDDLQYVQRYALPAVRPTRG
jgi:hypothetical protein